MAIYISNALYLESAGVSNRPLIAWNSCFTLSGVSSGDTENGFSASAVWSADTYSYWQSKPAGVDGATFFPQLTFVNDNNENVDCVAFVWQGSNASFVVEYSTDEITWIPCGSGGYSYRAIKENDPVMFYFDAVNANYFRVTFNLNLGDVARVAHVKIGTALQLQRPKYVGDIPGGMNVGVEKVGSKSYAGQHLGSVLISQGESFSIVQDNNTPEFIRSSGLQNFFSHAHRLLKLSEGPVETFFYAWRPNSYPNEIQYCGEITSFEPPNNTRSNGMMSWSMKGDAFR